MYCTLLCKVARSIKHCNSQRKTVTNGFALTRTKFCEHGNVRLQQQHSMGEGRKGQDMSRTTTTTSSNSKTREDCSEMQEISETAEARGGGDEGSSVENQQQITEPQQQLQLQEDVESELQVGDHVYQWRSFMGIPCVFQHHGIVMDVQQIVTTDGEDDDDKQNATGTRKARKPRVKLTIADFSNVEPVKNSKQARNTDKCCKSEPQTNSQIENPLITREQVPATLKDCSDLGPTPQGEPLSSIDQESMSDSPADSGATQISKQPAMPQQPQQKPTRRGLTQEGIFRVYTDTDEWHKVQYDAKFWQRSWQRAGTCTAVSSDPIGKVLARVDFIVRNPHILPDYHVVNANCECVAVWCKTGRWMTLQASSMLEMTMAGNLKSSATLSASAVASTVSVQVPAHGLWGWLGYTTTTQVSLLSVHPVIIPALAGYAVISIGAPVALYTMAQKQWKLTTERLQAAFWEHAMEDPHAFAECMVHWSDKS